MGGAGNLCCYRDNNVNRNFIARIERAGAFDLKFWIMFFFLV
jgi:hypothetical protein